MLSKLFRNIRAQKENASLSRRRGNQAVSVWHDTGQVYYLENTLKLTYQSKSGPITIEKLSLNAIAEVLTQLQALDASSPLSRQEVANQTDAFNISICGVTWQKSSDGSTTRIKALPEAALLRSPTACFSKSQAVFKHAFLLEHDDLLTPTTSSGRPGVFTYNRISIAEFTQQIAAANARLSGKDKPAITVGFDNFNTAFTEHEQQTIEAIIGTQHDNESLENK